MRSLPNVGAFTQADVDAIQANFGAIGAGILTTGNVYYVNPVSGSNTAGDGSLAKPFAGIAQAYAQCVSGNNDVVALIGNGGTTGTARVDSSFTWAKSATHLIGICSPTIYSQRARIAPTSTTTAFTPYWTVSGSGCIFQNIQWFMGFTTGTTSQIGMIVSGSRNVFQNCHIAGMGDTASAQSAGSRSLVLTGGGEHLFLNCAIGIDTVTRTQANASLEFAAATARNVFRGCYFPFQTSAAGVLGILATGNGSMDRHQVFENCMFINNVKSTSTAMTVLASCTTASPGGMLLFVGDQTLVGITDYGDTNGLANSFIRQSGTSAATEGIAIAPT